VARVAAERRPPGLDEAEAARRLARDGPNALLERPRRGAWAMLRDQAASAMVLLLLAAALLSAALGDALDAAVVGVILALNLALGVVQEYRADRSMAALKKLDVSRAKAVRSGRLREVAHSEIVRGDLVALEAGARVPADGRVVEAAGLRLEEASLTGESEPVDKAQGEAVFLGTSVVAGRGLAVVERTGMATELGRVAASLQAVAEGPTPLQRRLEGVARALAWASLAVVGVFLAAGLLAGQPARLLFMTAVGMAVAAVPEGLPAVIAVALAVAARRMLGRRALVRRLASVETLGSVTVICSDKTGTLTQNRMAVAAVEPADEGGLPALLAALALCNDAVPTPSGAVGEPTEAALVEAAAAAGLPKAALESGWPRVGEMPFDAGRKRMSTVHAAGAAAGPAAEAIGPLLSGAGGAGAIVLTKGAAESVLRRCSRLLGRTGERPLTDEDRARLAAADDRMSAAGLRVLAAAYRPLAEAPAPGGDYEDDLVFLGLVGLADPPRPEAARSVAACRAAGIRPVMITGDHPLTALAIARALGIDASAVVSGAEVASLSARALERRAAETSVFARVSPEHKLRIVAALQARGEIVAMTGDGVNDAPALKKADIGVAMGRAGTDVAKEAAAMVLLDDHFETIVAAVREGRAVYDNIRKFLKFLTATNAAELALMLVGPALGMPLPLTPLQILWVNLLTDGLPALALGFEPAEADVMRRPPRPPSQPLFTRDVVLHVAWAGLLMAGLSLWAGWRSWSGGQPQWRSAVLATLVLTQLAHALAIRAERRSALRAAPSPILFAAVAATAALQGALFAFEPLRRAFATAPPSPGELGFALASAAAVFAAVELEKALRRRGS
jgi:Ca2+-transporting ATPase